MANVKKLVRHVVSAVKMKNVVPVYQTIKDSEELKGRVALIVGGTGGIGLAIAKSLLSSGCKVIVTGTREESINNAIFKLGGVNNSSVKAIKINASDVDSFNGKVQEAVNCFGKLDIFINSAGVHTEHVDFWSMTSAEYDRVMNINLKGTYFLCQSVARYMVNNKVHGHILLVSSSRGLEPAWSPYGISKWGINGLVKGLAEILIEKGIIVNGIAPGSTATALIGVSTDDTIYSEENKVGRFILPEEVAEVAKLLVSPAGDMIVGEVVPVSGGRGTFDIR